MAESRVEANFFFPVRALSHPLSFESYLNSVNLQGLLEELGAPNADAIIKAVEYFSEQEAEKRDQIVLGYFGEASIQHITDSIVKHLLSPPKLGTRAKILDVGAGSGFFTVRVADEILRHVPDASFYAMDIAPAMLSVLSRKSGKITPFLGVAENIAESIKCARRYLSVPSRFDAVFSTLVLHHCPDVRTVFRSTRSVLTHHGKAVFIDLCEHPFKEFQEEMDDLHLGFDPALVEKEATMFFRTVHVSRMPGIRCECSGRSADLFVAYLVR